MGTQPRSFGPGVSFWVFRFHSCQEVFQMSPKTAFRVPRAAFGNRLGCLWTAQRVRLTSLRAFFSSVSSASIFEGCLERFAYSCQRQLGVSRVGKHFSSYILAFSQDVLILYELGNLRRASEKLFDGFRTRGSADLLPLGV